MEKRETIIDTSYDYENHFCVERIISGHNISYVIYDERYNKHKEVGRICIPQPITTYDSPLLNWYNLVFCSNNYGPSPDYNYMNYAVQQGKKTAATVYHPFDSDESKAIQMNLPENCGIIPYGEYMIFVYRKGKLSDFFNFERIREAYKQMGIIGLDWDLINDLFEKPLEYFADESKCGFSLQSGGIREQLVLKGLILGYPVESTAIML